MSSEKLWGGRFSSSTDAVVEAFSASVQFDQRLYPYDIRGSIAHAQMLVDCGVLKPIEGSTIIAGLEDILAEIERGEFQWQQHLEDVHMNIEARLTEKIGDVGKKLHTARSRNDQVATDVRLCLRDGVDAILERLDALLDALMSVAERHVDSIMPGFTHMQVAQPVTLGHHVMAWFEMLMRDRSRLRECRARINVSPLGSAALAGTSFPIDREQTAKALDFAAVSHNSLDAVSDRDFAIEFMSHSALLMMHLSRICEELVLWSSTQFAFADLGDAFCTGSSIMPQKKNPDTAELVRGKSARVCGNLVSLLVLMKAQPLTYNRDNQEDKEPLFDTMDTVFLSIDVMARMTPQITFDTAALRSAAAQGFATATDLADYLVRKGVPFRDAHSIVGKTVQHALQASCDIAELNLDTLQSFSDVIEQDVYAVLTLEGSVNARDHVGGTAPAAVRKAIAAAKARLAA